MGLHRGSQPCHYNKKGHLRAEAAEFHPDNGATVADELQSEDGPEQLELVAKELSSQEQNPEPLTTETLQAESEDECPHPVSGFQGDAEQPPATGKKYPFRVRKSRMIFTYHRLGQPTLSHD